MIMSYLQYLLRNITPLNIILAIVLIVLLDYIAAPMFGAGISLKLPEVKETAVVPENIRPQEQAPSISDYTVIAEQNLFNSGRTIPVLVKKEDKPVLPKPDIILYGTLISDDLSLAYIEDKRSPQSTPGRGKRQTALKKGDTISGYMLKDIEADKITLVREDDTLVIHLKDPQKPKIREVIASTQQQPAQTFTQPPVATQQKTAVQEQAAPAVTATPAERQEKAETAKKSFLDFFKVGQ